MSARSPCVRSRTHGGHGAHGKLFLFSILNQYMDKKYGKTPLWRVPGLWHRAKKFFAVCRTPGTRQTFFLFIQIWKHVSLSLTKCTLQSIIKLTKHITRSAYFKILYFSMHVYLNLNIPTLIVIILKKFKKRLTNSENYYDWTWTTFMWCIAHIKSLELKLILANHYAYTCNLNL